MLRNQEAVGRALVLFETSDYLTEILIRHPEEIVTLAELEEVAAAKRRTDICSRNRWG